MSSESNLREELLEIGVLPRPHGVRGELKLHLHHAGSDALEHVAFLVLELPGKPASQYEILSVRGHGRELILRLTNVADRHAAEALRGARVWVHRAALPELAAGEYYLVDLIGCWVVYEGKRLGHVRAVRPDPTVDTLVIELADGTRAEQPLLDVWVGHFDRRANTLELLSDDGLII